MTSATRSGASAASATATSEPAIRPAAALPAIVNALRGLHFGQVTITIHDGEVRQIDRTERCRLPADGAAG